VTRSRLENWLAAVALSAALGACSSTGSTADSTTGTEPSPTFAGSDGGTTATTSSGAVGPPVTQATIDAWNDHLAAASEATTLDAITAELDDVVDFDHSTGTLAEVIALDFRASLESPSGSKNPVMQLALVAYDPVSGSGTVSKIGNGEVTSVITFTSAAGPDGASPVMRVTGARAA